MGQELSTEENSAAQDGAQGGQKGNYGDTSGIDVDDTQPGLDGGFQGGLAEQPQPDTFPQPASLDAYRASLNLSQPLPITDFSTIASKAKAQKNQKNISAEILRLEGENAALLAQLHRGEVEPEFSGQGALGLSPSVDEFNNGIRIRGLAKMDPQDDSLEGRGMDVHIVRCGGSGEIGTEKSGIDQFICVIRGSVNFLCIESCTSVQVCCDSVDMAVLIMDCSKVTVMLGHDVPHITVQDSVGVEIVGGDGSFESGIECVGCYGVYLSTAAQNVKSSLGAVDLLRAERRRAVPIPERMFTHMKNGAMTTVCRTGSSAANAASFQMNPNRNIIPIQSSRT